MLSFFIFVYMINEFLNKVRRDFEGQDLDISQSPEQPVQLFEKWFEEAVEAQVLDPMAMAIATADESGQPSLRVVYLKKISEEGLTFFTDYDSQKGQELAANPKIATNFFWVEINRQVRVLGTAEKLSREASVEYFNSRPKESRISAIVSNQSHQTSFEELANRRKEIEEKYKDSEPECPENWGGYLIKAHRFEFWQGKPSRFHHRLVYDLIDGEWVKKIVAP